jgi:hypothetical protein
MGAGAASLPFVNTDVSAQATVDAPGGDSRPGLSPGWVMDDATILAPAIRLLTPTRPGLLTQSTEHDDGAQLRDDLHRSAFLLGGNDGEHLLELSPD